MKVLAVFALFVAVAVAVPADVQPEQQQHALLSADANPQADAVKNADRSKRFIFFSKIFAFPVVSAPVVSAPVVTKTVVSTPVVAKVATPVITPIVQKVYAAPPITYRVNPVTYTYTIPSYSIVKSYQPAVIAAPAVSTTVTKTISTQ